MSKKSTMTLSQIASQIAKGGYKEEELVAQDLCRIDIKRRMFPFGDCKRVGGGSKTDVMSNDMLFRAQVKKYKKNQFQQVDRHWIENLIKYIPELDEISFILKQWCYVPLKQDSMDYIDKSIGRKLLDNTNFKDEELNRLLELFNIHKRSILTYAFLGTENEDYVPEYLVGSEYVNNKRARLCIWKIHDIISHLEASDFEISSRKSVIKLGDVFSIQRKGGDGGRRSSNQLQMKIILSKLNIDDTIYINL
jgi:hypothetical protein